MSKTLLITVNSVARTAVVANTPCSYIKVREDGSSWTTDYFLSKPTNADTEVRIPIGSESVFSQKHGVFFIGQIVGYLRTVVGSVSFNQIEGGDT